MVKLKDIATATPDDIKKILLNICTKSGIDKKLVTIFIDTGGLHYVFEHLAQELYLLPKIDPSIRKLMRAIDIGFKMRESFSNLFEANYKLKTFSGWGLEQETEKVEIFRNKFIERIKKI